MSILLSAILFLATSASLGAFPGRESALQSPSRTLAASGLLCKDLQVKAGQYKGRNCIKTIENQPGDGGLAVISGSDFSDGIIEVDIAAMPATGASPTIRGFAGLAFRVADDLSKFEYMYIRASNGRAADQVQRNHSVQYASHPDFPWPRLRAESPEKYESYADLTVGAWTHLKIRVEGTTAQLFVCNSTQPCLVVHDLKLGQRHGQIALWLGPESEAYFANLTVTAINPPPYGSNPEAARTLLCGDARIYYESYGGGGTPLVFLHGDLFGHIGEFGGLIEKFRTSRQVIAISTRGHGRSDVGSQRLSYGLFAEDVAAIIRHETKGQVDLVGFSGGAITAYLVAATHSELVHRLVAIGGPTGVGGGTAAGIESSAHFDIQAFTNSNGPLIAERKKQMPDPSRWDDFVQQMSQLWQAEVYVTPEQIRAIAAPTLLISGDHDDYDRPEHAEEIYRQLPHGQLAIIPNAGHLVLNSNPELVFDLVRRFFEK